MVLPDIFAPTPRRVTSSLILASDAEGSPNGERYDSRNPLPNTPLHSSTPSVLGQQLPLNVIPDMYSGHSSGGGNVYTPRHGHNRVGSWDSARNSVSPSSKKSARFSPNLTTNPPANIHHPPPPGATPIRSAMRQIPSPARTSPQHRFPTHDTDMNFTSNAQPSFQHQTPPTFGVQRSPAQPSNGRTNGEGSDLGDNDQEDTPGQRQFRSRSSLPANLHSGSSPDRHETRSHGGGGSDDNGYHSCRSSVSPDRHARIPTAQSQSTRNTTSQHSQHRATTSTNQSHQASSFRVDQCGNQQRSSGSGFHTSWQAPRSPPVHPPVTPGGSANPLTSSLEPAGLRHAIPTPARPFDRSTNTDLPRINTSFSYQVGGQLNAGPRSSHTQHSQHAPPHGPARAAFTPANGSGRANVDVNSVINDLLRVPPTSVAWQTHRGVLTWAPHPAFPDSGPNLLGGSGNGSCGRVGNADLFTGGYPFPGACPTWTPGAWPPAAALTPATSRRVSIQLAPWIIPNPCNAALPHIMWDISQLPTTANRITGNHVIVNILDRLDDVATHPAVDRLVVVCQVGVAERFWGNIEVKASRPKGVTVWDVFNGIYEYFQKRVGRRELDRMKELLGDDRLEEKLTDAFYQRIRVTPALPGYELKEGLKRVDCLGDRCFFWGLYVSYNDVDNTWQLNLGLVNRRRCA